MIDKFTLVFNIFFIFIFSASPALANSTDFATIIAAENKIEQDLLHGRPLAEILPSLDELSVRKVDFIAAALMGVVRQISEHADGRTEVLVAKIENHYNTYIQSRGHYGTPKDHRRTEEFRAFLRGCFVLLGTAENQKTQISLFSFDTLKKTLGLLTTAASEGPPFFLPAHRTGPQGFNGFVRIVDDAGSLIFPHGLDIRGQITTEPDTVNVIVMNHSNTELDKFVMAHLLRPLRGQTMIIGAAHGWKSNAFADFVMSNEGMISVGSRNGVKYQSAVDQILDRFDYGYTNLFLFPEGSTGAGIGETKPLSPGFYQRLLPQIIAKHRTRLWVVTSVDTYATLGTLPQYLKPARIDIAPAISTGSLQPILGEDPTLIDSMIRRIWLEHFPTDSKRILGQLRMSTILETIAERTELDLKKCEGLL